VERIGYLGSTLGADGTAVVGALHDYVRTTVSGEWAATYNRLADPAALAALGALERQVVRLNTECRAGTRPLPCLGDVIADSLLRSVEDLHDARTVRLSTAGNFGSPVRWSLLLAMAFVSFLAVALIHADRPLAATVGSLVSAPTWRWRCRWSRSTSSRTRGSTRSIRRRC
jgi:hypothetical protein